MWMNKKNAIALEAIEYELSIQVNPTYAKCLEVSYDIECIFLLF